jgi:hypothetical protein
MLAIGGRWWIGVARCLLYAGLLIGWVFAGSGRSYSAATNSSQSVVIWLEAEQFARLGGWVNDAQFVDQMGSPYLLAIGLYGPVEDAVTEVEIPRHGRYRVWVRNRDWLPEFSPGRFKVILGGKEIPKVFGESKQPRWIWEDGGEVEVPAGRLEVRLRDLTGHYGRCDALVLSADPSFRPPDDPAALSEARERYGGVSREWKVLGPYDTVVVGGGLAGTFAAVASARLGAKTVLIQNRPVLGGNASEEILVNPEGDMTREPLDPGEGGIIEEVRGPVQGYSERLLKLVQAEPNLDLFLNTHATGVEMASPTRIAGVKALNVITGQRYLFTGRIFIDCTGDGSIGVWAGAEYRHGREPRSMYGETRAPEVGDSYTMGGTIRFASQRMPAPEEFHAPPWARKFSSCDDFTVGRHPQLQFGGWQWVIEYGGMLNTYEDAEEIRDELSRIVWGLWDHLKNHCSKYAEEAPYYRLTWVGHVVGKRESRRLIGDYVMTEHDIARQSLFPDRVAYGGWGIDLHPPGGFYDTDPPAEFSHRVKFSIPFRSLYSKDIENLMMAGRCISVSHAALGATRVMITCGLQGQAVGTAAALAKRYNVFPRELGQKYISELQQQLLKDGCYLIDLPNQDPRDLARQVRAVRASSFSPPVTIPPAGRAQVHRMDHDRAVMFHFKGGRLGSLWLALVSTATTPVEINATLCRADVLGAFDPEKPVAKARGIVPAQSDNWVEFRFDVDLPAGYYYVWLPRRDGLLWRLFQQAPENTARAYRGGGGRWQVMPDCYMFSLQLPEEAPAAEERSLEPVSRDPERMFHPENVINGFARAIRGWPNSWRPHPEASLPQWLELDFGRAVTFDTVHISFQSQAMRADDFRLEVPERDSWRTILEVRGNSPRRRVLQFPEVTADRLRLVIERARPDMGVCEIRVYNEP